ncbi:hypothetical protein Hanom_Chr04g00315701 [Helianthus anomalus]
MLSSSSILCWHCCFCYIALEMVKKYPKLGSGSVLAVLARKPEAFTETRSNIFEKAIKFIFTCIGLKEGASQKESYALLFLKLIWGDIAKNPKNKIDEILRGPADSIRQDDKTLSGWAIAMQLEDLISKHVAIMEEEMKNIITRHPDSTDQDTVNLD